MRLMVPLLSSAAVLFVGCGLAYAQVTTSPSAAAATSASSATTAAHRAASTATPTAAEPARVVYSRGQIEVDANNSSLEQIVQNIASVTGMKITGSVDDERVFGKYGPAAPSETLKSLLVGTNVNMMLKETANGTPGELILTPRNGAATPPSAAAQEASAASVQEPDISLPAHGPGGPQDVIRDINGVPVSQGAIPPAAAPAPPQTPEEIQQRIQQAQLQQQMQQRQQAGPH
jgi:hypothetical protein